MYGGDGGNSAADPVDVNYLYGEYTNLRIHRGVNGGVSQSVFIYGDPSGGAVCKDAPYRIDEVCFLNGTGLLANFVAPFLLDPNNANRLLGGALSLWRTNDVKTPIDSTNNGPTWAAIKPPDPSSYNFINAIAVASGNPDIIWVGHNFQALYVTTNGTAASPTWTKVGTATLPYRPVTSIALDPANTNIAYVSYGSFSANNIWKTTNRGGSWSPATGSGATGLPDAPVYSVVVHPSNSQWLYAGTEVGVFASTDAGATWTLPQDGPSNVSVNQLFWMGKILLAVTHGRGVFKTTAPISGAPIDFTDDPLQAGVTPIKAIHITELRQAIDTLRARYNLSTITWPPITAGSTTIRAVDVTELRTALDAVYVAAGRQAPTYSTATLTAGTTRITIAIIAELRTAILSIY